MEMNPRFLEERARALATVLLTRDPRVRVYESRSDSPYDLEVGLVSHGDAQGRMFAIELKAKTQLMSFGRRQRDGSLKLNSQTVKLLKSASDRAKHLPFPLLFMLVPMETDDAYFGWLREPMPGVVKLINGGIELAYFWRENTHTEIVNEVNGWYRQLQ